MALVLVLLFILAAVTVLAVDDKRSKMKRLLESERKERELIVFDLELARALAKEGKVYLVESADPLVDADYWRKHTFFLDSDDAEKYAHSISHVGGRQFGITRIREVTPADLPPTPEPVRPWTDEDHARDLEENY